MPVDNVRQALGSWDIDLHPDTPQTTVDLLDLDTYGFSQVVILPAHLPTHAFTDTTGLSLARYTGIYRANNLAARDEGEPVHIEGAHLSLLLGDEEGKGDNFEGRTHITARRFHHTSGTTYLTAVESRANGLTIGDWGPVSTDTVDAYADFGDTARDLLTTACRVFDTKREWRVNPDGTIDADTRANLYPTTTTPTVVILPNNGGQDGTLTGIEADIFRLASDLEDWASASRVNDLLSDGDADGEATTADDGIPAVPYYNFAGDELVMRHCFTNGRVYSGVSGDNVAYTDLVRRAFTRRDLKVSARCFDIERFVKPGDTVWVYDPDQDLYDNTNQIHYRGEIIFPTAVRVEAVRWPVEEGMGVYLRHYDPFNSVFVWDDLTPHVMWEDRQADLQIGSKYLTLPRQRDFNE